MTNIEIGDNMEDLLWKLFKETGDIKYFLFKQKMKEKK